VQDAVGVAGGEVLRVRALAEGQLPGERPLGPLGGDDLLAVAVVRGALGLDRQDAVLDGHLDAVRVGAGQVGLDMVTAVLAAVDVHRHAEGARVPLAAMEKRRSKGSLEGSNLTTDIAASSWCGVCAGTMYGLGRCGPFTRRVVLRTLHS